MKKNSDITMARIGPVCVCCCCCLLLQSVWQVTAEFRQHLVYFYPSLVPPNLDEPPLTTVQVLVPSTLRECSVRLVSAGLAGSAAVVNRLGPSGEYECCIVNVTQVDHRNMVHQEGRGFLTIGQ